MKNLLLSVLVLFSCTSLFAQNCSELFFGVYYAGANNDKALEIYNPTNATISLAGYHVDRYSNGSQTPVETFNLTGSIPAYSSFLVTCGQTDSQFVSTPSPGYWSLPINDSLQQKADLLADSTYPGVFYFNGNDALTLAKGAVIVDIFGKIGQDPGKDWSWDSTLVPPYCNPVGGQSSKDLTYHFALTRKASVKHGVTTNPSYFNGLAEYDSTYYRGFKYTTGFKHHACDCNTAGITNVDDNNSLVNVYPNPVDNNVFFVNATEKITDVYVYDLVGKEMQHVTVGNGSFTATVEVGKLATGSYLGSDQIAIRQHGG